MSFNIDDLPVGNEPPPLSFPHFPTLQQAVIWRNWGLVPITRLARILQCSEHEIMKSGEEMGLTIDDSLCETWSSRGYLTIIRRNWHLLPYSQILMLLNWSPERMDFVLKTEDFMWLKMGKLKPKTMPVVFRPLTDYEKSITLRIKAVVEDYFPVHQITSPPFSFLKEHKTISGNRVIDRKKFGLKMIYSYSGIYGDSLLDETMDPYPDNMLEHYAAVGINAVWVQGILHTLVPWLGENNYSFEQQKRLNNLQNLIKRARKYGIAVYLYINEPRAMPADCFIMKPDWKGNHFEHFGDVYGMCTSAHGLLSALSNGMEMLMREVPDLGGVFTISMSENPTHCWSKSWLWGQKPNCPRCAERNPAEIVAEVNAAIARGLHRISPQTPLIVWNWGWNNDQDDEVIRRLPNDVKLMCTSETALPTCASGIVGEVYDYSISHPGPGPIAVKSWSMARGKGMGVVAKIQVNNTWECAAVPYLPVPGLIERHLKKLRAEGITDLMVGWTLGGYPGGNLELLNISKEEMTSRRYGKRASAKILLAFDCFDRAFEFFPLHHAEALYAAPQNYGPMNLLFAEPTNYRATMLGFPYDDLDYWRGNHYPVPIFEQQFQKLSEEWQNGLVLLNNAISDVDSPEGIIAWNDLASIAETIYCHFRSTYLQIKFIRLRNSKNTNREMNALLDEEIEIARKLHKIVIHDSRIGFEPSNQYLYVINDLKEKVLNCIYLKEMIFNGNNVLH